MTLIEAKETLAKVHMCQMIDVFDPCCTDCEHCQLYVTPDKEKEAFNYLYSLMKEREYHD